MAYTGMNKADWESRKYINRQNALQGYVQIAANTGLAIGTELYVQAQRRELEGLRQKANVALAEKEQEIYHTLPPEDWSNAMSNMYDDYLNSFMADSENTFKYGTKQLFKDSIQSKKAETLSEIPGLAYGKILKRERSIIAQELESTVNSENLFADLKAQGVIDKSITQEEASTGGFLDFDRSTAEVSGDPVYSPEIDEAYKSGASSFDVGVLRIKELAKRYSPNDPEEQDYIASGYIRKLRELQPYHDLAVSFSAEFRRDNVGQWNYVEASQRYAEQLANTTYGGQPLSATEQQDLKKEFRNKYNNLTNELLMEANEVYTQQIQPAILEAKIAASKDGSKAFGTKELDDIYTRFQVENNINDRFLIEQYTADYALAWDNELDAKKVRFLELHNSQRNNEEEAEYIDIREMFNYQELEYVTAQAKAIAAAKADRTGAINQGFAEVSNPKTLETINDTLGKYLTGEVSRNDAVEVIFNNSGSLSRDDFMGLWGDLAGKDGVLSTVEQSTFYEKVYKTFIDSQDTIFPGDIRKLVEDAGLDPYKFEDEISSMEKYEAQNQYEKDYSEALYNALLGYGYSEESIEALGFPVSETQKEQGRDSEGTPSTSPSQTTTVTTKASGSPSKSAKDLAEQDAGKIHDKIMDNAKYGARRDLPGVISYIEMMRIVTEDQVEWEKQLRDLYVGGELTDESYNKYRSQKLEDYQDPAKKDGINRFKSYIKSSLNNAVDSKGKKINIDNYTADSVIKNWTVAFSQEYDAEMYRTNGQANVEDIINRVYKSAIDTSYMDSASNFIGLMTSDMSDMYKEWLWGLGGSPTESYKQLNDMMKGQMLFVNERVIGRLLADPQPGDGTATPGLNTGKIQTWNQMYDRGESHKDVGLQVMADVAEALGVVKFPDGDGKKKIGKFLEKQPPEIRNQVYQTAVVAKMSLDVRNKMVESLGDDVIRMLDPDGVVNPTILGNTNMVFGVEVGGVDITFNPQLKGNYYLSYAADGSDKEFTVFPSTIKAAEKDFLNIVARNTRPNQGRYNAETAGISEAIKWYNKGNKNVAYQVVFNTLRNGAGTEEGVKARSNLINTYNMRADQVAGLTGKGSPYITNIDITVDYAAVDRDLESGDFGKNGLNSYLKIQPIYADFVKKRGSNDQFKN